MLRDYISLPICLSLLLGACKGEKIDSSVTPADQTGPADEPVGTAITLTVEGEGSRFGEDMLFAEVNPSNEGRELIVSAPGLNQVLIYAVTTGALLQTLSGGELQELGARLVELGDLNDDAVADLLLTHQGGLVLALSGSAGFALSAPYTFPGNEPLGGVAALTLVQPATPSAPLQVALIRDRSTPAEPGSVLSVVNVTAQGVSSVANIPINTDGSGVYRLASGEWTNEGKPELALGMPLADNQKGAVRVYSFTGESSGVGLNELTTFTGTSEGDRLGFETVFGKVSNDDVDDLVFSAPWSNEGLGAIWALDGGVPAPAATGVGGLVPLASGTTTNQRAGLALAAPATRLQGAGSVRMMMLGSIVIKEKITISVPCDGCRKEDFESCDCKASHLTEKCKKCCCTDDLLRTILGPTDPEDNFPGKPISPATIDAAPNLPTVAFIAGVENRVVLTR